MTPPAVSNPKLRGATSRRRSDSNFLSLLPLKKLQLELQHRKQLLHLKRLKFSQHTLITNLEYLFKSMKVNDQ